MSLSLAVLIITASSTLSCGPKRVVINGVEMDYEEGAKKIFEQGQVAQKNGDVATAKARYREVADDFAESASASNAIAQLGDLLYEEGGCNAARMYFERLALEHPLHSGAARAKKALKECEGETTSTSTTLATVNREFDSAGSDAERKEVASKGVDSAIAGGDFTTAVRWLLKLVALEVDPAQKESLESEVLELIDERVSFKGIRQLLEEQKEDAFPKQLLTYKLARIQYHVRDHANASDTLKKYLEVWPAGTYQQGVKDLTALIEARTRVNPKTIGVLLPLSGRYRKYGENALEAIQLGLGQNKSKINLVVKDTKSDGVEAAKAVQELTLKEGAIAILGPIFPRDAEPAAVKAQQLGVPILTISSADELGDIGPYVFRNSLTNKRQAKALVEHAVDILGMKTFAIIYPRHPYGEELMHLFWDEVDQKGGEIRAVESYATEATTFTSQVKNMVARNQLDLRYDFRKAKKECEKQPDTYRVARCKDRALKELKPIIDFEGLFIPDYPRAISMISAALAVEDIIVERNAYRLRIIEKTLGRKVKPVTLLGVNGWNSEKLLEQAQRNVEYAVFTDGFFAQSDDKATAEFVTEFQKKHHRTPRLIPEALFYDSIKILKMVVDKDHPSTREGLRTALRRVHGYPGVTGKTSFAQGPDADKTVRILSIKNNKIEEVPDPDAQPPEEQEDKEKKTGT